MFGGSQDGGNERLVVFLGFLGYAPPLAVAEVFKEFIRLSLKS